jgi:alkaline phosphatase D
MGNANPYSNCAPSYSYLPCARFKLRSKPNCIAVCFLCLFLMGAGLPLRGKAQNKRAQKYISAGPMVGASLMREAKIWAQLKRKARVRVEYWELGKSDKKFTTANAAALPQNAFVIHLCADSVQPGKIYEYSVWINNKKIKWPYPLRFQAPPLWYRRQEEAPNFRFALGSCAFINDSLYDYKGPSYGGGYEIFAHMYTHRPQFMLWLGDNVYFRESDWESKTGMVYRYTHARRLSELQPFINNGAHLAIWDDHDFGPNDSSGEFILKDSALAVFQQFWANPSYGMPGISGVFTQFQWSDCDFFLLDNRYHRTANFSKTQLSPTLLGKAQLEWLIGALVNSKARFKIIAIGGQVLNTAAKYETYINLAPKEREELLERIGQENIKGVIFVSGDRHHSEVNKIHPAGRYPIYEFTVSPLTSGAPTQVEEVNENRVEGSLLTKRAFGIVTVESMGQERRLTLTLYNGKNQAQYAYQILYSDFKKAE